MYIELLNDSTYSMDSLRLQKKCNVNQLSARKVSKIHALYSARSTHGEKTRYAQIDEDAASQKRSHSRSTLLQRHDAGYSTKKVGD